MFKNYARAMFILLMLIGTFSQAAIQNTGMIGTTSGCFGLNPQVSKYMVPLLKNGSLPLAFYNK
jgi:hypothetical protein